MDSEDLWMDSDELKWIEWTATMDLMDSDERYGFKWILWTQEIRNQWAGSFEEHKKVTSRKKQTNAKKYSWDELVIQLLLIVAAQDKEATMCWKDTEDGKKKRIDIRKLEDGMKKYG